MMSLVTNLAPLALGGLLGWSGSVKVFGRSTERQAVGTALERVLNGVRRATRALRVVGAAELLVAAALLAAPALGGSTVVLLAGAAAACLGAGFTGYLGYAKVTAPESSCGCTASDDAPIGTRAFIRAGLVAAGGIAAAFAAAPWWETLGNRPWGAAALLAVFTVLATALFADLDRYWLLPVRRLRLRAFGHPLGDAAAGAPAEVPLDASVELLERSLAWEAADPVVRSGLLDHWDDDGWRFLLYSGAHEGDGGTRQVSVLFALDARATVDGTAPPAVRVTVIDEERQAPVPEALPDLSARKPLPLAN